VTRPTLSFFLGGLLSVLAMTGCGASGGPKTDASVDHPGGGAGGAAGGSAGNAGAAGAAGASATGAAGASATGAAGASATGAAGAGGGAGAGGTRDGGATAGADGGAHDGGCPSQNPDPCICGRPDGNALYATECRREKACRDGGGVWEPYVVELPEGGSYGPRCQSADGSVLDAY
jgi:hypothetical protein